MPALVQQSIVKYLNMAREFPDILSEHKRILSQNLFLLNVLRTGHNSGTVDKFLTGQLKEYQQAEKTLVDISQKHAVAKQLIEKYPDFKDQLPGFTGLDMDLSLFDAPVIAAVALLTGSILTLYDDISYKIKVQNTLLSRLQGERQKLNDGTISQDEYDSFAKALDTGPLKASAVNLGGVLVITGLIFGGYYVINNTSKVDKLIRKVLNP